MQLCSAKWTVLEVLVTLSWNAYSCIAVVRKIRCSWDATLFCEISCSWNIGHGVLEHMHLQCCTAGQWAILGQEVSWYARTCSVAVCSLLYLLEIIMSWYACTCNVSPCNKLLWANILPFGEQAPAIFHRAINFDERVTHILCCCPVQQAVVNKDCPVQQAIVNKDCPVTV